MAELVAAIEGAEYIPTVVAGNATWSGAVGLVTDVLADLVADPPRHEFYVSGPPVMVRSTLACLEAASVPISQIHYDTYG